MIQRQPILIVMAMLFLTNGLCGQQHHRYIIQLDNGYKKALSKELHSLSNIKENSIRLEPIFKGTYYRLWFEARKFINEDEVMSLEGIKDIFPDLKSEQRRQPDDPDFPSQTNLKLIGAEQAWDFTTGGKTSDDADIVIAILDDGFDVNHEDLRDNIWTNEEEISNNGIDDDNNGYIDDINGINVRNGSPDHTIKTHGTAVMGIIGAGGDNSRGISGVNWNIQMMLLSNTEFVSEIIEAYDYVREQRKRYNDSDGREGAFVVATNFSAGIPEAFEEDQPLLCEVYNSLGEVGVLSVSSAPNRDVDIDLIGDLPADCSSQYLIVATNTRTDSDELFSDAGIGANSVDIGAPGDGTISTKLENSYDGFGGTSASAPHVAGAIGLLYSVECQKLVDMTKTDPSGTALYIKNLILDNSDQKSSLGGVTVSGGRLNVFSSMVGFRDLCNTSANDGILAISSLMQVNGDIEVQFTTPYVIEHHIYIHNAAGQSMFHNPVSPSLFGLKTVALEGVRLTSGLYFVSIEAADDIHSVPYFIVK